MPGFTLRLQTKSGQLLVDHLTPSSVLEELERHVSQVTEVPLEKLALLKGYPPKALEATDPTATLESIGIITGDTLIVKEMETAKPQVIGQPHTSEKILNGGPLMRKIVPADNSCLFTSIGFVLGGVVDTTCGSYMRKIIVEQVSKDEENYSEAILGKPNKEYCDWISKPESWGGAIELAVLSHFYGLEIAVVDTISAVINRFGEDKNYQYRVFLIFDGVHYDPLYKESLENGPIQTLFPTSCESFLKEAEELAQEAKSSKQYTDVNNFTLQCQECGVKLTGQLQARQHAQTTGHMKYGEVSS